MKGYGLFLLVMAILLLIIPLPALSNTAKATGAQQSAKTQPSATTKATSTTTAKTTLPKNTAQGTFRILCDGKIVTLTEREFLIRTLAMEMLPSYHTEALKAQTVAAYTYYSRRRANPDPALNGADFATPYEAFPQAYTQEKLKERWGDQYDAYYQKITDAVDAVAGKTIRHKGKLIDACYHAVSNGCTESAETVWGSEVAYLQAVASPGDRLAPGYTSSVSLSPTEVKTILKKAEPTLSLSKTPSEWFGKATLSPAGTVEKQAVGDKTLSGTRIREVFGLRSATFSVTYQKERFVFTVCGYGHGVGMSQHGADYLARQGYDWQEILTYYYKGVTIV